MLSKESPTGHKSSVTPRVENRGSAARGERNNFPFFFFFVRFQNLSSVDIDENIAVEVYEPRKVDVSYRTFLRCFWSRSKNFGDAVNAAETKVLIFNASFYGEIAVERFSKF